MIEADPILGGVVGIYPSDRARLLIPAGIIVGGVAVALNFTVAAVAEWWGPFLSVVIAAAVMLAVGWRVLHFWNREFIVYENGFTYREGERAVAFLYQEVVSLRQRAERLAYFGGLIRYTAYRFTLVTIRDEKIVLDNLYRRVAELGERVEVRLNRVLEPALHEQLAKGEFVAFSDSLRVSNTGLHEKGRSLEWGQFAGYQIQRGRLQLLAQPDRTEWLSLPLAEVDNITLLLGLLRQHQATHV
jgi:hypothetical protein